MGLPRIGVQAIVDGAGDYLKGIKSIEKANSDAVDSVKSTAKSFDVLNDSTDYARSVQKRYAESLKEARSALNDAAPAVSGLESAFSGLALALGVANIAFGAIGAVIGAFAGIVGGLLNIVGNVVNAIGSLAKAIIDSIGNAFNFVKDVVVDIGKKVFDFGKQSVVAGIDFSKSMANISAVTKITGKDLRTLTNDLIAIGSNAVAGPKAVAEAYYDIAGGVQDAGSRMDLLKLSIATAEAGQADLKDTTTGMINVFNAYKYGIAEATVASDVFTQTTNLGTKHLDDYVKSLSSVAGLAAANKIGFEELGAAEAFLTTKGFEAGEAGTAINSAIVLLSRNTPGVTRALRSMGEQSIQSSIANNGLAGTLKLLVEGADKTGQNLTTLVGRQEALKAATMLGTEEFKEFFKTFTDGLDEATSKAREIQRLDVSAQLQLMQSRFEGISLSISQAVLPALNKFLQFFNKSIAKIDWKKIGEGLQVLGEKLGESAGNLVDKLSSWLDTIDWNKLADDATNFLSSVGDAIAGIDWDSILNSVAQFMANIGVILKPLGDLFTNIDWNKAFTDATTVFQNIANFISSINWQGLVQMVADVAAAIGRFVSSIDWAKVGADVGAIITQVTAAFEEVGKFIANIDWATLGKNASDAITTITDAIANINWQDVTNQAMQFMQGASNFFSQMQVAMIVAQGVITQVTDAIANAIKGVWTTINTIKDAIIAACMALADGIAKALGPAAEAAWNLVKALNAIGGAGGGGSPTGTHHSAFGSNGSVNVGVGSASGGVLQPGLNIVGERGAEAIYKVGDKLAIIPAPQTKKIMQGLKVTPAPGSGFAKSTGASILDSIPKFGGGGGNLATPLNNFAGYNPNARSPKVKTHGGIRAQRVFKAQLLTPTPISGAGNIGHTIQQVVKQVATTVPLSIMDYIQKVGLATWRSESPIRMMPQAMPIPVGAGDTNSNVTNNRNIENVNFYGGNSGESAVQRFARLRMIGKV